MKIPSPVRAGTPSPTARAARAPAQLPAPETATTPGSLATLELLQRHSLTSVVQAEIERLILSGEVAPGEKLTEALLAERLGVSRGPIREAFRSLEEAGLVRLEKNRGVFVRRLPLDEAADLYDLRAMLEEAVGRRLAEQIQPEQLKGLRGMVDQMERLVRDGHNTDASEPYHRLNLAFHDRMVEVAGNRPLLALYRRLVGQLSLFRRANLQDGRQIPVSVSEHRAILKAIAAGDKDAAGLALRKHVLDSKERSVRSPAAAPALNTQGTPRDV